MTQEQEKKLNEVYQFIQSLKSSSSIPIEIDQSFRERFIKYLNSLSVSTKSAISENQLVDEAGASTYSVLKNPDLFVQIVINNTTYYIPAFT